MIRAPDRAAAAVGARSPAPFAAVRSDMCGRGFRSCAFAGGRAVGAPAFATVAASTTNIAGTTLTLSRL